MGTGFMAWKMQPTFQFMGYLVESQRSNAGDALLSWTYADEDFVGIM